METREEGSSATGYMCNMCSFHRKYIKPRMLTRTFRNAMEYVCLILFLSICVNLTSGYNLDVDTATVHAKDTGSYFGYSVALHEDQGSKW